MIKNLKSILFAVTAMLFTAGLFAQETTSDIQGIVTDEKGSPLAGATISALHIPTGTRYTTTARKDGRYNLPNLRIGGPYLLTVSFVGFKTETQENITLNLGQEFTSDFKLNPESQQMQEVVVTGTRQDKIFNTSHTGSQEVINRSQIERLPTINRSLQDFTKLTPSSNGLSFGGRNNLYNNVTVDGANFNNAFGLASTLGGQTNSQPISIDAIEQIQVNLSPYDVRQGGFSGAGINSVTRSGTNQFKGSIYTYIRTPGLLGYNVRTNKVPKGDFDYKLRGFSVGGPIIKNKLFFFVSGEQERLSQPATTLVANKPGQTAVPGVISQAVADTLDALKNFLISKYGYDPGFYQGYNYKTQSDKITARIDYNISSKHTLTLKYNYLKSFRDQPASNSGAVGSRQPSNTGLPFSGNGYTINNNFNIFIGELNSRFSSKMSNKFQIGYTALRDFRASLANGDFPLVDILNGQGSTYTSFGFEPFTYNNLLNTNIFQVSDIFTYYTGKHELTFGTQNYKKDFKNGFSPNYEGLFIFNSLTDFYNSANNGTANSRTYLLSYSLTKDGSFPFALIGATELGFFAQDKWRVKDNFTLTYGLRVDAPIFENKFESNTNVPALSFRDGKHYDVGQKPGTNPLISPRLGFNWDVFENHKTQVRGGIGSFSGPPPFVWISNQASNNGVQFGSISTSNNAFKSDINAYRPASGAANTSYNLVLTDKDFKYPQVLKASIAADQKLPWNLVATVEYMYSKDINAVNFENVNLPSTGTALVGPDNRIRYSSTKIYSGAGGATVTNPNITNAILMKNYSKGYGHVITAQLQRTTKNLYASVAYTYSDIKTLNDGGSIAASMWRDRPVKGDPNTAELGRPNFYQPNRVIAQASYRIEYAKYFATSIGLVFEAAPSPTSTVFPLTGVGSYTYSGDLNNDGTGGNNDLIYIPRDQSEIILVPVNTGGGTITDARTASQIWNQLNNFINQDPYLSKHRGEYADRNAVVMPYFKRLDLNITQDFYLKEKWGKNTLRVSLDIVNVGNLLNKNWGLTKTFTTPFNTSQNAASFLKYEGLVPTGADAGKPRFSFPYQDAANQIPFTSSFTESTSTYSRWQMQIGIRYLFN
ncbi:MAG TPA: TonB-dependent receptor [Chitinophagaceae bacterium]|jgi:outer membrane receptor for ferrienterochelin and colicin|nr:TonB-dependent receptor [Chitinophagaceae bacterium]